MSKYSTELRHLLSNNYDIGLQDYPIFDESYRAELNAKIIEHYKFCEIGAETPGRFKIYLNRTMNEIMPLYNQQYLSAALAINPLVNFDLNETTTRENSGQTVAASETASNLANENTSNQANESLTVRSDTPASLLLAADLKANVYASEAGRNESTGENTGTNNSRSDGVNTSRSAGSGLEVFSRKLIGNSNISQSDALIKYRKTFLNIDMQIISDLATCFMGVW